MEFTVSKTVHVDDETVRLVAERVISWIVQGHYVVELDDVGRLDNAAIESLDVSHITLTNGFLEVAGIEQ